MAFIVKDFGEGRERNWQGFRSEDLALPVSGECQNGFNIPTSLASTGGFVPANKKDCVVQNNDNVS